MEGTGTRWLVTLCLLTAAQCIPSRVTSQSETDSEDSRRVLGSSVVTSVSVIMDHGNGTKTYFADGQSKNVHKPTDTIIGSPGNLLSPDRYEFYTFDETGDLVKRLMTLDEIHGLIAGADPESVMADSSPTYYHDALSSHSSEALMHLPASDLESLDAPAVHKVLESVQNVLKNEMAANSGKPIPSMPSSSLHRPDSASAWSALFPGLIETPDDVAHLSGYLLPSKTTEAMDPPLTKKPLIPTKIPLTTMQPPWTTAKLPLSSVKTQFSTTTEKVRSTPKYSTAKPETTTTKFTQIQSTTLKPSTTKKPFKPIQTFEKQKPSLQIPTLTLHPTPKPPVMADSLDINKEMSASISDMLSQVTDSQSSNHKPLQANTLVEKDNTADYVPEESSPELSYYSPMAMSLSTIGAMKPVTEALTLAKRPLVTNSFKSTSTETPFSQKVTSSVTTRFGPTKSNATKLRPPMNVTTASYTTKPSSLNKYNGTTMASTTRNNYQYPPSNMSTKYMQKITQTTQAYPNKLIDSFVKVVNKTINNATLSVKKPTETLWNATEETKNKFANKEPNKGFQTKVTSVRPNGINRTNVTLSNRVQEPKPTANPSFGYGSSTTTVRSHTDSDKFVSVKVEEWPASQHPLFSPTTTPYVQSTEKSFFPSSNQPLNPITDANAIRELISSLMVKSTTASSAPTITVPPTTVSAVQTLTAALSTTSPTPVKTITGIPVSMISSTTEVPSTSTLPSTTTSTTTSTTSTTTSTTTTTTTAAPTTTAETTTTTAATTIGTAAVKTAVEEAETAAAAMTTPTSTATVNVTEASTIADQTAESTTSAEAAASTTSAQTAASTTAAQTAASTMAAQTAASTTAAQTAASTMAAQTAASTTAAQTATSTTASQTAASTAASQTAASIAAVKIAANTIAAQTMGSTTAAQTAASTTAAQTAASTTAAQTAASTTAAQTVASTTTAQTAGSTTTAHTSPSTSAAQTSPSLPVDMTVASSTAAMAAVKMTTATATSTVTPTTLESETQYVPVTHFLPELQVKDRLETESNSSAPSMDLILKDGISAVANMLQNTQKPTIVNTEYQEIDDRPYEKVMLGESKQSSTEQARKQATVKSDFDETTTPSENGITQELYEFTTESMTKDPTLLRDTVAMESVTVNDTEEISRTSGPGLEMLTVFNVSSTGGPVQAAKLADLSAETQMFFDTTTPFENIRSTVTTDPSTTTEEPTITTFGPPPVTSTTTPKPTTTTASTTTTTTTAGTTAEVRNATTPDYTVSDANSVSPSAAPMMSSTYSPAVKSPGPSSNAYRPLANSASPSTVELHPAPHESMGLEASVAFLGDDVRRFADLCNELSFKMWTAVTGKGQIGSRSLVLSPFELTAMLAMVFLGARGPTSGQMNDVLRLDDMVTFNPHQVLRNITHSITNVNNPGVATASFVREIYSNKGNGKILDFYKERVQQYYDGHVEEVDFNTIGDVLRRRTNLLVKRQTLGRVVEYLRGSGLSLTPPFAAFSANVFQTSCESASTEGRDGEMYFVVRPSTRQRRLVPVPAAVWRGGFLAGYEPGLDATAVCLSPDSAVSTILVLPGQQGQVAPGDGLARLEQRLIETSYRRGGWSRILRSLLPRPGLELQVPRFSHRSVLNTTAALQKMGLKDVFNEQKADLRGVNGLYDLYLSDMLQVNTFSTCGEDVIGARHHVETYPASPQRMGRVEMLADRRRRRRKRHADAADLPLYSPYSHLPLNLRPRQARLPDVPRLRFDRPFLYLVRHNPTGMIVYLGRFNPRLLP